MFKRSLLVILLFFALVSVAWGATYYVDTGADPGGDGTNQYLTGAHCAFKTIAQVNADSFSPGDSILFKRGCTWREILNIAQSGSAGNVITFGAYGSGALPIISGADLVTSWSDNGSNVWKATVSTAAPNQVMFNNILGTKVGSIGACNSDKKWYWASNVLYIYGTQDPNITYPNQIEASVRSACINPGSWVAYVIVDSICTEKGNDPSFGSVTLGTGVNYFTVQNSETRWNYAHGYFIYSAAGADLKFLNNSVHDNGCYGIAGYQHAGASAGHEVIISGNEVYNNRCFSVGEGIYVYANYYIVEHNNVHDNGGTSGDCIGIHIYTESGDATYGQHNIIRYNKIYNQICNNSDGSGIEVDNTCAYNQIYYNICYHNYGPGIDLWNTNHNTIYNNVCYDNLQDPSFGGQHAEMSCANTSANNNYKNNIAYATQTDVYAIAIDSSSYNQSNVISNNEFYAPNSSNFYFWNTVGGNSLATFNGLSGVSTNLNSDPLMQDPANGNFHLQPTSPCTNAGVDVGLTQDFYGNPVPTGSAPDIGAAEYQVVNAAPTVTSLVPTIGPVGTVVTITGTNFTGATAVSFGSAAATSFTVSSATQITATVPPAAVTGKIRVSTPAGYGDSTGTFCRKGCLPIISVLMLVLSDPP